MTTSEVRIEELPAIADIHFTADEMIVTLGDGRKLSIPLDWYPRLQHARPEEQKHFELFAHGHAIEWPELDEHIHVEGLLAGRRSGESEASFERWLASRKR